MKISKKWLSQYMDLSDMSIERSEEHSLNSSH